MATAERLTAGVVVSRVGAALLGGYVFIWGAASLAIAALVAWGADFHDAEQGVLIAAFLVFLGVFVWAIAAPRLVRVWAVLVGGGLVMTAAAWFIQRAVLAAA